MNQTVTKLHSQVGQRVLEILAAHGVTPSIDYVQANEDVFNLAVRMVLTGGLVVARRAGDQLVFRVESEGESHTAFFPVPKIS